MEAFKEAEINELIMRCRDGDEEAFESLVHAYTPMMTAQLSAMGLDSSAFTDAAHALYRAALSYDTEQRGVTFGLYAKICVTNRLTDILRAERQMPPVSSLDVDDIATADGTLSRLVYAEESAALRRRARECLSELEYRVLLLWLRGDKTSQIARELETEAKSVDNAKSRILKKLRAAL